MAIVTWPAALSVGPGSGFGQARYDLGFSSDATGASQDRVLGPPRWQLSIVQPNHMTPRTAGQWQAVLLRLRGRVNHLQAWDFGRLAPVGTARGALTLASGASAGATILSIAGVRAEPNRLLAAQSLDNAAWTKAAAVITADAATAPDGTATADTMGPAIDSLTTSRNVVQTISGSATGQFTFSVFVKYGTLASNGIALHVQDNAAANNVRCNFILSSGAAGTPAVLGSSWTADAVSIQAVGSGWYRCALTLTTNTSYSSLQARVYLSGFTSVPDTTGTVHLWGAQFQSGGLTAYAGPGTLLAGDLLQVGTGLGTAQVVMVTADAAATDVGAMTVSTEPPLRVAHSSGAVVVWDKPSCYFKLSGQASQWAYTNGRHQQLTTGITLDLLEHWT